MIRRVLAISVAPCFALLAITVAPTHALAYTACQSGSSGQLTATSDPGGASVTYVATFKDCNGNPVSGATVTFSQASGPGNCHVTFSSTTAVTNAEGQASVTVTLPVSCPGQYVLGAAAQGVQVQATLVETGGFPATGSAAVPSAPTWVLLMLGGGVLGLLSLWVLVRSFARS